MKKLALLFAVIFLAACSMKVDENLAKQKATELLEILKNHQYEKTNDYYSDGMNASESIEARRQKFMQIESAVGEIVSYELISSEKKMAEEREIIELKYKVICKNSSLTEIFILAMDEGECKVLTHSITNQE